MQLLSAPLQQEMWSRGPQRSLSLTGLSLTGLPDCQQRATHCQMVQKPIRVPHTIRMAPGTRPILCHALGVVIITAPQQQQQQHSVCEVPTPSLGAQPEAATGYKVYTAPRPR